MKTGMKSFVLVSVILAFFILNLSGCKGKKEEETQISQQGVKAAEEVKKNDPVPKDEAKPEEKKKIEEEIPILTGVEEVDVPKFIWKTKIDNDWISRAYIVDKEIERALIKENDSLSQILSEESAAPFFLLKGKEKQYLVDIKGNSRKEIPYLSSDLVVAFDKKSKKVIGKTRGGEVIWDREWEMKYDTSMISPDKSWAILSPTPISEWHLSAGENIVAIHRNGEESWRLRRRGLMGSPRFSDNGKKLAFGIHDTLYYASKEKILWEKKYNRGYDWLFLEISPSGNFMLFPILNDTVNYNLINNKGMTLWVAPEEFGCRKFGYSKNEKFLIILGERKAPGKDPFFIIVVDVKKRKIIKRTIYWIKSESPLNGGILDNNSHIKIFENKYLTLCIRRGTDTESYFEVYLYDISHILNE